ncbi:Protein Mei2, essential for commitment to meiosis [Handroanthus impetiginosus]|uniref:Protein Mei2, essential for commitment to meiosis n=1 Tax=Handroanthus impetiginosus TaxID=429701 RepID=A0A2G9GKB3_9LAMI|nr:Protein Mei2, essential for commitment to meiosis [Handroanthus impetiginosus]
MNEPGFPSFSAHHLDPGAQEFFPTTALVPPQMFYPYPPPPYDNMGYGPPRFPSDPAFVEPPPPLPVSFPPSSATPSRTLLLSMVPASVSESTVRRELEVFGDVRAVQMERRREGLVTVHFYDVRDAQAALMAIQEQHMQQQFRLGRHYDAVLNNSMALMTVAPPPPPPPPSARGLISGRVVWAQFTTPVTSGLPDGNNQGTLVIFNLDPGVSTSHLKEIFEAFGPVKELRETPNKRNQRFVEFYDVRDAAKAMAAMNGKEIYNKTIVIEFSRPGGQCKKLFKPPQNGVNINSPNNPTNSYSPRNTLRCYRPPPPPPPPKGSGGSKSSSSGSSLHGYEECSSTVRPNKKNNSKKTSDRGGGTSKQHGHGGCRPWKGNPAGGGGGRHGHDPRFLINEDAILESNCRDSRTTVMIKNIPNKYSQKLLLNMLDNHCIHCNEQMTGGEDQPLSSYDFVYLPIDFINKCNVGYGFVNMTSPQATLRLYKAFHHQNWEVFNSRKICEVTYARLQGLDALREHFKNSKFPGDAEEYMPVVFSPPRDGRILSDPVPIVGRSSPSLPLSPHSSAASSTENQSEPPQTEGVNGHIDEDDQGGSADRGAGSGCSHDENDDNE